MSEIVSQPLSPAPQFPNGEYAIDGVVGTGGMAIVYRARDLRRPRTVAIKVLRWDVVQAIGTERFLREIAVTAGFSHPHILPLLDSGETIDANGRPCLYYVMPLMKEETLADRIEREHRLPLTDALRLTREILGALRYAHQQGVIHRDIKPANVLISDGHAVVTDFGVARPVRHHTDDDQSDSLTETGIIVGTPTYMSPEQALGDEVVDERSDIYAVGCVLYEMLVGVPPFEGHSGQSLVTRKISGVFLPATSMRTGMPTEVDEVLATALSPEAADRYPSAEEFLAALAGLEHRSGASSAASGGFNRRMTRRLVAATLITVAVALAAATIWRSQVQDDVAVAESRTSRLAVLPLELIMPDSTLEPIAHALAADMIDELAQYPALTVISRNGVLRFRGSEARVDSVATVLNVGTIVTGDVRRIADQVHVTVRLINGTTGAQMASVDASGTMDDVLKVRSRIIDSVTSFVRKQIGAEIGATEKRGAKNANAWERFARVQEIMESEQPKWTRLSPREHLAQYSRVDSLLAAIVALDPQWNAPEIYRGRALLELANSDEQLGLMPPAVPTDSGRYAADVRRRVVTIANAVLTRSPDDAHALYLRGKAELALWRTAKLVAPDSLRAAAEADLRTVVTRRRDFAEAWYDLSVLLNMTGDYEGSRRAAESALKADAYLKNARAVLSGLFFASLATGHVEDAKQLCSRGQRQYGGDPRFWMCDLTILGWTGHTSADVGAAWRAVEASEKRDANNILVSAWGTRRLLVAAVAARAGLGDSAQAIVQRVRAEPTRGAPRDAVDYGEAHVHALLGHNVQAIPLLARYLRSNPALRGQVRHSPWFASLRGDSQFVAITTPQ